MEDDQADNEEDMFESGVTIATLLAVADLLVVQQNVRVLEQRRLLFG